MFDNSYQLFSNNLLHEKVCNVFFLFIVFFLLSLLTNNLQNITDLFTVLFEHFYFEVNEFFALTK